MEEQGTAFRAVLEFYAREEQKISRYLPSKPGIGHRQIQDLNIIDDVRFSKVQNMAHWRNLAAAIR